MPDRPILPQSGREYDPSVAQDHTGIQFNSGLRPREQQRRDPRYDPGLLMKEPAWHRCPQCNTEDRFRLLVESSPDGDGLIQFYCQCGSAAPIMQLGQPQITDHIAKRLGIHVPDPSLTQMMLDLDLER